MLPVLFKLETTRNMTHTLVAVLIVVFCILHDALSFLVVSPPHKPLSTSCSLLFMGKGFNRGNKQADLMKKMKQAKQQKQGLPAEKKKELSEEEIKRRNDRLRFDELLESAKSASAYSDDGYLSQAQEEEEITAARSGVERLFEGDPMPDIAIFKELIASDTGLPLQNAQQKLDRNGYLVLLTDPRPKSYEFRQLIQQVCVDLSQEIVREKLIIVNADTPAENKRWAKKSGLSKASLFSDVDMAFMKEYSALGDKRWAVCMFIIAKGRVQKIAREVNPIVASRVIQNAIQTLDI